MKVINGFSLPNNDSYFTKILQETGSFEPGRMESAFKYVRDFQLAIDAGAHVGLRSRELSPRFSSVYAFEPTQENYRCLVANISPLSNVSAFQVALGDREGEVTMRESSTRPGNSGAMYVTEGTGTRMRTLDSFGFKNLNFLKIDCEGYELPVLQGGKDTILQSKPVIFMEEKNFKDRAGRLDVDYLAAGRLLEEWGARKVETIKNDVIYSWN